MRVRNIGYVAAVACAILVGPGEAAAKGCTSGEINRGGQCTRIERVEKNVRSITRSLMGAQGAKAAIVRIQIGHRTIVNKGLGISQVGVRATPDMKFRPGAMAIPLLTSVALQLQDEGRLDLDDPLSRWFPSFPNASRVTLRMLSSVTSGYPDYIQENPPFQAAQLGDVFRQWNDTELLNYAFAQPLICDPGACFHYAHTNFVILGHVLEKVTGKSLTRLMKTRMLGPLGLRDTKITKLPAIPRPALHAYSSERNVYEDSTGWSPSWGVGKGLVMASTARDMTKAFRAVGTGKLFSRSARRQLIAPLSAGLPGHPPSPFYFGLGILTANTWMIQNPEFNGFYGAVGYLPSRKLSILVETTHGRSGTPGNNISSLIFAALARYLTPGRPV